MQDSDNPWSVLEVDMGAFNAHPWPRMTNPRSLGNGLSFLNRLLCGRFFGTPAAGGGGRASTSAPHRRGGGSLSARSDGGASTDSETSTSPAAPPAPVPSPGPAPLPAPSTFCEPGADSGGGVISADGKEQLVGFLTSLNHQGQRMLDPDRVTSAPALARAATRAEAALEGFEEGTPWQRVAPTMHAHGLLSGWGRDVGAIRESLGLLSDILQAPDPDSLAQFLSRLPHMVRYTSLPLLYTCPMPYR